MRGAVCVMSVELSAPLLGEVPATSSLRFIPWVRRAASVVEPFAARYGAAELAGPFAPAVAAGLAAKDLYDLYGYVKRSYGAENPGVNIDKPFVKRAKVSPSVSRNSSRPSSSGSYNRVSSRVSTSDSIYRRTRSRGKFFPIRRKQWWR